MEFEEKSALPTVLFRLAESVYGIGAEAVKSFEILDQVHELPGSPNFIRGVINMRGNIVPLMDLRMFLGMRTVNQEIADMQTMLEKRKQDHLNWLAELEKSVEENREFRLPTDPHACAFGKWYDSYHTNDNRISSLLGKFSEPHEAIHAIGIKVKQLQLKGEFEQARQTIDKVRANELKKMLSLFTSLIEEYTLGSREIVMIFGLEGYKPSGIVVDEIISIEDLKETEKNAGKFSGDSRHFRISKRVKDDSPVILLEPGWLQDQFSTVEA